MGVVGRRLMVSRGSVVIGLLVGRRSLDDHFESSSRDDSHLRDRRSAGMGFEVNSCARGIELAGDIFADPKIPL